MEIRCVWEHNGGDTLLYAENLPGAFTRGPDKETALEKIRQEAEDYFRWMGKETPGEWAVSIRQEKASVLAVRDADSDVLFETERMPMTAREYDALKALALKSAEDFLTLYQSIPDPDTGIQPLRRTFYGNVPRTAREMYEHTKNVNSYYFGEIEVETDNQGTILECRQRGFAMLEGKEDYLSNPVLEGSYGEDWSVRKVLRRFIWHDRIHAKAMYRMAVKQYGFDRIPNVFRFGKV